MTRTDRDRQRYEMLVQEHARALYQFAYRLCGQAESAEDVVQETFLEAWRSIHSLRDTSRGKAWLFRILRRRFGHSLRDRQRDVARTAHTEQLENIADAPGRDILDLLSDQELLRQAIDALDEPFREVFLLVFGDGLSCQEAADVIEIPLGTVLSRIHRARGILRTRLRQLESRTERPADLKSTRTHEE